ncbi:MAG: imidazole glycerol phosphate synthase subunit HisH [Acidimicrobiaceae bacterium]|nr:imidazole glycerol phosphate synthase subunit HisH [Acidimicrobiaceae bacterium]
MSVPEAPGRPLLAVLDYGIGNLHSAYKGFSHVGADTRLTADRGLIRDACGVVLPGVGAFGPCMRALRERGLDEAALDRIEAGVPFFGICIGMQMLFAGSAEAPEIDGLGVFPQLVRPLPDTVKRPQIQWNRLNVHREHPMLADLGDEAWVYFVHSYAPDAGEEVIATCDYGGPVTSAVARDNVWAAQFHPEKSGATGLRILSNFVAYADDKARAAA